MGIRQKTPGVRYWVAKVLASTNAAKCFSRKFHRINTLLRKSLKTQATRHLAWKLMELSPSQLQSRIQALATFKNRISTKARERVLERIQRVYEAQKRQKAGSCRPKAGTCVTSTHQPEAQQHLQEQSIPLDYPVLKSVQQDKDLKKWLFMRNLHLKRSITTLPGESMTTTITQRVCQLPPHAQPISPGSMVVMTPPCLWGTQNNYSRMTNICAYYTRRGWTPGYLNEPLIQKLSPPWHSGNPSPVSVNLIPVMLPPASVNIHLGSPKPAFSLPEISNSPEQDHHR